MDLEPAPLPPPRHTLPEDRREGPLAMHAAKLLRHGFTAVRVRHAHDARVPLQGFAGNPDRIPVLDAIESLGKISSQAVGAFSATVQLPGGERLLYRQATDNGAIVTLVGHESFGDHRKSTPRNVKRIMRNVARPRPVER